MSIFCLHPADVLGRLKLGSCHMPCVMTEAAIGQVTDILGRTDREITEVINIQSGKPSLNRSVGQEFPLVLLQNVSHDRRHVTQP